MTQARNEPVDTRQYRTSWRLTFGFDGEKVALVRQERLQKVAPGTTTDRPEGGKNSGAWLEMVDRSGRVLFHRLLEDPLQTRAERHSPDGTIELHVRAPEPSEFITIIPDIPDTTMVILYSSPTEHESMNEAAREIGRYSLGQDQDPRTKPETSSGEAE